MGGDLLSDTVEHTIDDRVITLVRSLTGSMAQAFPAQPKYQLDSTWPSIGVVDLLVRPLRGKKELTAVDEELIHSAAAYLGGIAFDCWVRFSDSHRVALTFSEEEGVVLSTTKASPAARRPIMQVALSHTLRAILSSPESPFPFFEQARRPLTRESNLLSPFAIGLTTGLSRYGDGRWSEKTVSELPGNIVETERQLAHTCVTYYERVFPGEPLGQELLLYHSNLLLPPSYYHEEFPALTATGGLLNFHRAMETGEDELRQLSANLTMSPDEQIRDAGFSVLLALRTSISDNALLTMSEMVGGRRIELKPAISLAGGLLGHPQDWVALLTERKFDHAKKLMQEELLLGLLPFMRLSPANIERQELIPIFHALSWGHTEKAREYLHTHYTDLTQDPELWLQQIFLDLSARDLERASEGLNSFLTSNWGQDPKYVSRSTELAGLLSLQSEKLDDAVRYLMIAFQAPTFHQTHWCDIGTTLTACLLKKGDSELAKKVIERIDQVCPYSIANKLHLLTLSQEDQQLETEALEFLLRYAPLDHRVFAAALDLYVS